MSGRDVGEPARVGPWRAVLRGWPVFVPVVVVHALIQTALVAVGAVPGFAPLFVGLVAASVVALIAATAVTVAEASSVSRRGPFRLSWRVVGWTALWIVATALAALVHTAIAAVVVVVAALMLPVVAAGSPPRWWFAAAWRTPWRTALWMALTVLAVIGSAVLDFELAFLFSDLAAAALAWLKDGIIAVVVLCASADLAARAQARGPTAGSAARAADAPSVRRD